MKALNVRYNSNLELEFYFSKIEPAYFLIGRSLKEAVETATKEADTLYSKSSIITDYVKDLENSGNNVFFYFTTPGNFYEYLIYNTVSKGNFILNINDVGTLYINDNINFLQKLNVFLNIETTTKVGDGYTITHVLGKALLNYATDTHFIPILLSEKYEQDKFTYFLKNPTKFINSVFSIKYEENTVVLDNMSEVTEVKEVIETMLFFIKGLFGNSRTTLQEKCINYIFINKKVLTKKEIVLYSWRVVASADSYELRSLNRAIAYSDEKAAFTKIPLIMGYAYFGNTKNGTTEEEKEIILKELAMNYDISIEELIIPHLEVVKITSFKEALKNIPANKFIKIGITI